MSSSKIVVIGSSNTDMLVTSDKLPEHGETIIGGEFIMNPGGKGANQAVAAARLGGNITFISKVGNDIFGNQAIGNLKNEGIRTEYIIQDPNSPSGVALIMVNKKGENCISVAPGANGKLLPEEIEKCKSIIDRSDILLIQLEIPLKTVERAIQTARKSNTKIILDPAPAYKLPGEILENVHIITPNESEAQQITGIEVNSIESARKAATRLKEMGPEIAIVTLGARGAYVKSEALDQLVSTKEVNAMDTTAAGDTFNGALAIGISEQMSLLDAIEFANSAASVTVTKMGAQSSIPYRRELKS